MDKKLVFFLDVDNTLLDNDRVKEGIRQSLIKVLGKEEANHFWQHHDSFRERQQLVDFPNIIREYCTEKHPKTCEIKLGSIFQNIDFPSFVYPDVVRVIEHLKTMGKVVIFSEGDMIYQKAKIEKSGLAVMVTEVLLYEHKMEHLDEIMEKYQAYHSVFIEDRADILKSIKEKYPAVTTVLVCQGHYANPSCPNRHDADLTIEKISDLLTKRPHSVII